MKIPRWKITLVVLGTVGVLVAIPLAVSAATQSFVDVPPTDWAYNDIQWLAEKGLTAGCGDGTNFCPDGNVTRREIAVFNHREEQLLGTRHAVGYSENISVPHDVGTLLATVYITVPTAGGAVTTAATVGFQAGLSTDLSGFVWIEANNNGLCNRENLVASTVDYSTQLTGFASPLALGGFPALVGEKRIDVCAWGVGAGTAWVTEVQATWIATGATGGDFVMSASTAAVGSADDFEHRKEVLRQRVDG